MTDPHSTEDEFFEQALRPLDDDAAPADSSRMADAVAMATEVFASQQHSQTQNLRTGPMLTLAKPVAVLTASAAMLAVALLSAPESAKAEITLGRVLDLAMESKTLQLEAVRDGKKANVWISGDTVRWQDSPQQYRVARGNRLWKIDESAGEMSEANSPWVNPETHKIDLVAMLGSSTSPRLRNAKPTRQVEHGGVNCNVFEFQEDSKTGLVIRAFADVETHVLKSIAVWPGDTVVTSGPPIAELRLLARNVEIDESKFVVGSNLSQDNRIGKVRDAQGIVQIRPMTHRRWTPVAGPMIIKTGDWIRTDVRGANAVAVETTAGYRLILGPGSLLEVNQPAKVVLHRGEVQVTGSSRAKTELQLSGPEEQTVRIAADKPQHILLDRNERFSFLSKKPKWLRGFEGSSTNESLGSLIARVDGRDVPLTVGYHKVKVEIRDQIARTTIEESFVNGTGRRLEGVFHFPLPQDASISGFGMWINGELIEADVVEKQRAREIYETILREKRDPGLLEWAGGNIFKARVFPIEAHSEKRIKIVYTQVLPMRANRYRYSYALRSEMLQKTPMRELSLQVLVNSALKLKSVTCPTHSARTDQTDHSASVEFSAQEYIPTRDFELVCEVDSQESDVVVVPHRRGEDGYFMAQVTPPSREGNWQREVLPDGAPLQLLVVCDTSGSMTSQNRSLQQQFVTSVLSCLGESDRFNLAVCDVDTLWKESKLVAAKQKRIDAAVDWLANRRSLGWTDLDRMTMSVIKQLKKQSEGNKSKNRNTHVIYIGDGIVTARDANPQAFINRIRRLTSKTTGGTFHAVSVGSSFESGVLKSIAAVGGGSVRKIDGEQTPQRVAHELLNEVAQPGLRDLKVEFNGIQVAAVYPNELPNLAAGTQQILIGRYLSTGNDQSGQITITGSRNGETVKYSSRITMQDAETGNSFIPRLWARAHLDHLLEQGSNEFIKDEIIALSEEFHIMTPYTSLLVLESDKDRERFGVKRRFLMRDGERFFAEGRSRASFELVQKQMKAAGNWRTGLRRRVLRQLADLGRNASLVQLSMNQNRGWGDMLTSGAISSESFRRSNRGFGGSGGGMGGGGGPGGGGFGDVRNLAAGFDDFATGLPVIEGFNKNLPSDSGKDREIALEEENSDDSESWDVEAAKELNERDVMLRSDWDGNGQKKYSEKSLFDEELRFERFQQGNSAAFGGRQMTFPVQQQLQSQVYAGALISKSGLVRQVPWLNQLFPTVPATPPEQQQTKSKWSDQAKELAGKLIQPLKLEALDGLQVELSSDSFDTRWNRQTSQNRTTQLFSSDRWLTMSDSPTSAGGVNWCTKALRGIYSVAFQLGRTRKSVPADLSRITPGNRAHAYLSLQHSHHSYDARVEKQGDEKSVLILQQPNSTPPQEYRVTIDTVRDVVLRTEWKREDKVTSSTEYSDYIHVADCWWPGTIQTRDAAGHLTSVQRQTVSTLAASEFDTKLTQYLPGANNIQLLRTPLPSLKDARVASDNSAAGIEHELILLLDACSIQDWQSALQHLKKLKTVADPKPGLKWIRMAVVQSARKNEELRQLAAAALKSLAMQKSQGDLALANHILNHVNGVVDRNEFLALLDIAKPVYQRQPEFVLGLRQWQQKQVSALTQLGRTREALEAYRNIAQTGPWDYNAQTTYAQQLANAGEFSKAKVWLKAEIDRDVTRVNYSLSTLRYGYANLLRQQHAVDELIEFLGAWMAEEPENNSPYAQYLSALMMADRTEDAHNLVLSWLNPNANLNRTELHGELKPPERARLGAAVAFALGQSYGAYSNELDPRWYKPLADTAIRFLQGEHHSDVVSQIFTHYRFRNTEAAERIRENAAEVLQETAATRSPYQLTRLLNWTVDFNDLSETDWKKVATTIRNRWDGSQDLKDRRDLGEAMVRIYAARFSDTLYLPFLRQRVQRARDGDPAFADQFLSRFFEVLLTRTWAPEIEAEAFDVLRQLDSSAAPTSRAAFTRIVALHRLVDRMQAARIAVDEDKLKTTGHPEELTRTELAAKKRSFQTHAQRGLMQRLSNVAEELRDKDDSSSQALADWVQIERMYLQVVLADTAESNDAEQKSGRVDRAKMLTDVRNECWKILGDSPIVFSQEDIDSAADDAEKTAALGFRGLRQLLQNRAFAMISNLALRKSSPRQETDRALAYIDKGLLHKGSAAAWRSRRIAMLLGLDRPELLQQSLRQWIREEKYQAPHQLLLARLLAEQGEIDEAIKLFETVERRQTLSPADYKSLADWYMVVDRKEDHRRAHIQVFKATEEWRLSNWLNQHLQPWHRTDDKVPGELDERVLYAFQALFEKSSSPGSYVHLLRSYYTACRDFRLLRMVPDSVIGRTPQQIYGVLGQLQNSMMHEVRNEATADQMMERLVELRNAAKTPIDRRALDLLESMIERRSAMVLNQPGPHIENAVAAMKRAFDREWADGEVVQMASFLTNIKTIEQPELAAERLRELRALLAMCKPGTADHLNTAWQLAFTLYFSHRERNEAVSVMENALGEFRAANPGGLPKRMNSVFGEFIGMLENIKRFGQAEKQLQHELQHPVNASQKFWMLNRLHEMYHTTIINSGRVSLGSGEELYTNLYERLLREAKSDQDNYRYHTMTWIIQVLRTGRDRNYREYKKHAREYAFVHFPRLLRSQSSNYRGLVQRTADTVHDLLSPRDGLAFVLDRMEAYPSRLESTSANAWQLLGGKAAQWRHESKQDLSDLEPRLLKRVLVEIWRDLSSQQTRSRTIYSISSSYFWTAKSKEFERVAEEVAAANPESGQTIIHVARYMYNDLHLYDRSLEIMLAAQENGVLNTAQQIILVDFLFMRRRHAEAIPILKPIVKNTPDKVSYRTRLITAFVKSQRMKAANRQLAVAEEHFRHPGRWTEHNLSRLAACCTENSLWKPAVRFYGELIPLHQRTQPNRGIGNGTLSSYYSSMAQAYSGQGKTVEAVDAAAAAVVSWGPRHSQRTNALDQLENVLWEAKDLDEYVAWLDQQAEESGTDSPIVRSRIGNVYFNRNEYTKAIGQLKIAIMLQPTDLDTHQTLTDCYQSLKDSDAVTRQMLAWIDFDRHNLDLYIELAHQLKSNEAEAERAATSLVEAAPLEASHHQALAEFREQQRRWNDAIDHWLHVAELRSLEPNGLINLAEVYIQLEDWRNAHATVSKLSDRTWPQRFNVRHDINRLQKLIPAFAPR